MVRDGGVRELDRLGNNAADEAADFGRGRGIPDIDTRRNFGGVCGWWYPVILILHRFFTAISRAVDNHVEGDGTAPDPLVWSAGALPMRRRWVHTVRDRAFPPGPAGIWDGEWITLVAAPVTAADVGAWPYFVGIVAEWVPLWGGCTRLWLVLTWGSWAYLLLKFSFCMSFGLVRGWSLRRLSSGIGGLDAQFQCRLFRLVQALIFGVRVGSCGALFRALSALPGGVGRFMPCDVGANHCKHRHIGWQKFGHGLTSRPRESVSECFLNELLLLFKYPPGSATALFLLEGTLPLRYCAGRLASRFPTWQLHVDGHLAGLVTEGCGIMRVEHSAPAVLPGFDGGCRVDWVGGPGGGVRRVRLNRKTPAHLARHSIFGRVSLGRVFGRD